MRALNVVVVITLWIAVVALFITGLARVAFGQYDEKTELHLVQCVIAECDSCINYPEEPAAIMHVQLKLMNRYNANPRNKVKRTLDDQVVAFCAVFDKRSKHYYGRRAERIRQSTFRKPLHLKKPVWKKMRYLARLFLAGHLPDPATMAMDYGGDMDVPGAKKKGGVVVVKYSNTFLRYR